MLKPHFSRQIIPVAGDVTDKDLISDADRQQLESNVSVVIHLAGTVSFTEPLRYKAHVTSVTGHVQVIIAAMIVIFDVKFSV